MRWVRQRVVSFALLLAARDAPYPSSREAPFRRPRPLPRPLPLPLPETPRPPPPPPPRPPTAPPTLLLLLLLTLLLPLPLLLTPTPAAPALLLNFVPGRPRFFNTTGASTLGVPTGAAADAGDGGGKEEEGEEEEDAGRTDVVVVGVTAIAGGTRERPLSDPDLGKAAAAAPAVDKGCSLFPPLSVRRRERRPLPGSLENASAEFCSLWSSGDVVVDTRERRRRLVLPPKLSLLLLPSSSMGEGSSGLLPSRSYADLGDEEADREEEEDELPEEGEVRPLEGCCWVVMGDGVVLLLLLLLLFELLLLALLAGGAVPSAASVDLGLEDFELPVTTASSVDAATAVSTPGRRGALFSATPA